MTLTDAERQRFIAVCRQENADHTALAREAMKLGPHADPAAQHLRAIAAAYAVVQRHLEAAADG